MMPLMLLLILTIVVTAPAFAQRTQPSQYQGAQQLRSPNATSVPRQPVATRPSRNPFRDPIGQGVPPAASSNPNLNSNQTNTR
jgi:hypothetical protein